MSDIVKATPAEVAQSHEADQFIRMVSQLHAIAKGNQFDVESVVSNIYDIVLSDEELADKAFYVKPVGKDNEGQMQFATGPSVHLARLLRQHVGNIHMKLFPAYTDGQFAYIRCIGIDAAKLNMIDITVPKRITYKNGSTYQGGVLENAIKAGMSIAERTVLFDLFPATVFNKLYKMIHEDGVDDVTQSFSEGLERLCAKFSIEETTVLKFLQLSGTGDAKQKHLTTLRGIYVALDTGECTPEDIELRDAEVSNKIKSASAKAAALAKRKRK